jgi:DNA modification methylase
MNAWTIHVGDALTVLRTLPDESAQTCVTSPPYWGLRDYGEAGQIGLEQTPDEYVARLVDVFRDVRRVLRDDGTLWLNLGDSYAGGGMSNPSATSTLGGGKDRGAGQYSIQRKPPAGLKPKDLVGIPWRVAFALQADGWYLRSDIVWAKPNPMPESVTDRPTKAHEYLFLLAKGERYYYDIDSVREPFADERMGASGAVALPYSDGSGRRDTAGATPRPRRPSPPRVPGRNRRTVWTVATQPFDGAHFAAFPPKLIEPCILAGCPVGGTVLDPFNGAGTTGLVAVNHGRRYVGIELNPTYAAMAEDRIRTGTAQQALFHVGAA